MDANKTIRPEEHLRAVSKKYLLAWQQLAMFRAERGKDDLPAWPDWCYCPVAGAYAIVSSGGALPAGGCGCPGCSNRQIKFDSSTWPCPANQPEPPPVGKLVRGFFLPSAHWYITTRTNPPAQLIVACQLKQNGKKQPTVAF